MSIEDELAQANKRLAGGNESGEEETQPIQPFSFYLKPAVTFKIVTTKWGLITMIAGVCYLYEICWAIAGVNNYTDISRNTVCGSLKTKFASNPTSQAAMDAASAVYDTPLLLVTFWHIIEWLRWTVLLTTALVDANLIPVFYFLSLVIPYGFIISLIVAIGGLSGADMKACADVQPGRSTYVNSQLICFFLYFIIAFAQVWFFKIKGVDWCHEQWLDDGEEDED